MPITAEAHTAATHATGADLSEREIEMLREELDELDAEILAAVRRRVEITRRAGLARIGAGLPQVTQHSEMQVLRRFEKELGRDGVSLGMLLLRLGRSGAPRQH